MYAKNSYININSNEGETKMEYDFKKTSRKNAAKAAALVAEAGQMTNGETLKWVELYSALMSRANEETE